MKKGAIRTLFLAKRLQLSLEERTLRTLAVLHQISQHLVFPKGGYALSFIPMAHKAEMDTTSINAYLQERFDLRICYPKIEGNSFFACYPEGGLQGVCTHSNFLVQEPSAGIKISAGEISIVLVPLLAFDLRGHRVGYGKGMYDSFFKKTNPMCIKVGCSFFPPVDCIEDVYDAGDEKLNIGVTPQKTYWF